MRPLLIISFFFLISFNSDAIAQKTHVLKKGYTVAFSESSYEKMMDAVSTGDDAYFNRLIQNMEIMVLPRDIEVYLLDTTWSGSIVVRIKGESVKLWTVREALKD